MDSSKIQFIIATHSELSKGLMKTLEFIAGKQSNIKCFTAYVDDCADFENQIDNYISAIMSENIVVVTDIFGGSVNNHIIKMTEKDIRIHLISGVNLPLMLSLVSNIDGHNIKDEIRQSIEEAKNGIIYCNEMSEKKQTDNLDEF